MTQPLYADGVTDISIVGSTARIRFHLLEPKKGDAKDKPQAVHAFTVVMPVEALAQLGESIPALTKTLLDQGRLKKRAPSVPAGKAN